MTLVVFADRLLTPVQIFACFNELKFNTQSRMNKVIATSIGSAAITYEVVRSHEANRIWLDIEKGSSDITARNCRVSYIWTRRQ